MSHMDSSGASAVLSSQSFPTLWKLPVFGFKHCSIAAIVRQGQPEACVHRPGRVLCHLSKSITRRVYPPPFALVLLPNLLGKISFALLKAARNPEHMLMSCGGSPLRRPGHQTMGCAQGLSVLGTPPPAHSCMYMFPHRK